MSFEGFVIKSFLVLAGLGVVGALSHPGETPRVQTVQTTPVQSTAATDFTGSLTDLAGEIEQGFHLTHAQAMGAAACIVLTFGDNQNLSKDAKRSVAAACISGVE